MRSKGLFLGLLLLAFILFTTVAVYAGTTGKIVGKVTDAETDEPLPGVNVVLDGTMLGAATDLEGEFIILRVPPGIYSLRVQMMGYSTSITNKVSVSVDMTTTQHAKLSSSVLDLGEEIEVVAERELVQMDMTSSLSAVSSDQIDAMPVQEIDDVLELQAGLVRDAGGGLHVRGGRSGEVAYWIDGIAATDVYSGDMGVEIENASVQELQVISGTFNAEYGQAMSGIINIVTKDGSAEYSGEISAFIGDYVCSNSEREFGFYRPYENDISAIRSPHADSVEQVNPLSDYNSIYNLQASLSGPVPVFDKLNFFSTIRYFSTDGYLYGLRWFTPQGEKGDEEIVPMAPLQKLTGQFKLSYQLSPSLKLSYNIMGNKNEYRIYDRYYKYNPDGDYQRFENGQNHILSLTHVLNSTTFYDLKFSYFNKEYKHSVYENSFKTVTYDTIRTIDGVASVVPRYVSSDETYVHPDSNNRAPAAWSFQDGGMKMDHFKRNTTYGVVKFDMTSQVTKKHQMKLGLEGRFYTISANYFSLIPEIIENEEIIPFQPMMPKLGTQNRYEYEYNPIEFAAYIQDKMEFKNLIINLGLRFDYFDSDGQIYADPKDPNVFDPYLAAHEYKNPDAAENERVEYTLAERENFWWKDASVKYQISPRFGIAYPITDQGVIHFSYGHFFQIPSFEFLYGQLDISKTEGNSKIISNSDLSPQKTVMYEIGLQQGLAIDIAMDLTLFYRDIRDWVGSSGLTPTYLKSVAYTRYINKDYSNVKGVTFTLKKRYSSYFEAALDYAYMVTEGTASDPDDEYNDRLNERAPRIQIIPLAWDQRHTINAHFSAGTEDFRVSFLGRFWTGTPYTPTFARGQISGASAFTGLEENSALKPTITTFDLKLYKEFTLRKKM
ncbi:TonB-dependent receptor, partial [bacterium]|nr:TonB-dependent receptor [bacterium]